MRGRQNSQPSMLCIGSVEDRIPASHPIRKIKRLADEALKAMDAQFDAMYASSGRPSIPPERLLKAQLLMALFSVSSERKLCERIDYDLMFRFFLDMDMAEPTFDPTTFSQNRERLLASDAAYQFLREIVALARCHRLMSDEHFSVDGTLIEAWASHKSFRPKDEDDDEGDNNGWSDFKGQKRSNTTHESKTDPDTRLAKKSKGQPAKLSYSAHALMDHQHGLLADFEVALATGTAEREVAIEMLERTPGQDGTVAADKGYDTRGFIEQCQDRWVVPYVARNTGKGRRKSAVPDEVANRPEYTSHLIMRRRVEQIFGWMKTVGGFRRTRYRRRPRVRAHGLLVAAAYNLIRMSKLITP